METNKSLLMKRAIKAAQAIAVHMAVCEQCSTGATLCDAGRALAGRFDQTANALSLYQARKPGADA